MLEEQDRVVSHLRSAIFQEAEGLEDALPLLRRLLEEKLWQRRVEPFTGKVVEFKRFVDFVQTSPPEGLGTTFEQLWDFCYDDPVLLDLLDQAVVRRPGARKKSQGIEREESNSSSEDLERPTGTSKQAGLRRLRKQAPELHQKVLDGEMSVNAALIKGGLRIKQITVFIDPKRGSETLLKYFTTQELTYLIVRLIVGLIYRVGKTEISIKEDVRRLISALEENVIREMATDVHEEKHLVKYSDLNKNQEEQQNS